MGIIVCCEVTSCGYMLCAIRRPLEGSILCAVRRPPVSNMLCAVRRLLALFDVCVCVRACVRACVRVCVCVCKR